MGGPPSLSCASGSHSSVAPCGQSAKTSGESAMTSVCADPLCSKKYTIPASAMRRLKKANDVSP